jgi:hypothetical protein
VPVAVAAALDPLREALISSGSQMDVVHASPPFAVSSAWDFVSRRQLVVRAGSWEVLGPWK